MDILRAEGISKTYRTGSVEVKALKQCSINIQKGDFTAVIGKSGSGKSTLLRILGTIDKPDSGKVYIDDTDISTLNNKSLARFRRTKIGFIYQDYSLVPEYTAYENIILPIILDGKKPDRDEVSRLMDILSIGHCLRKLPSQMSGGEQQRAAIARAMIAHPAVILADEPTGNLDVASAQTVVQMLAEASNEYNQTIIMVTHDKQMAEYADKLLTIVDGHVSMGVDDTIAECNDRG